jgi:hypothetical protein
MLRLLGAGERGLTMKLKTLVCMAFLLCGTTAASSKKLALSPCNAGNTGDTPGLPADALCGTYEVFENRAAHSGRKIPLRVALVPANAPEKEPDAIV